MSFLFFLILIFVGWNFYKALKKDMKAQEEVKAGEDQENSELHREKRLSKDQVVIRKKINKSKDDA